MVDDITHHDSAVEAPHALEILEEAPVLAEEAAETAQSVRGDVETLAAAASAPEKFRSADHYVERLIASTTLNRQLKLADILDHHRVRQWSNMTIRVCCSDGRIGQADFVKREMTSATLAHQYSPQAGALILRGLTGLSTIAELDAYYEANREQIHEVLSDRFRGMIEEELAWQREFVAGMQQVIEANDDLVATETAAGRTNGAAAFEAKRAILRARDARDLVRKKEIRIVLESHSASSAYLENPEDAQTRHHCAAHGCGAMKSNMEQALSETLKQGYVIDRWLREQPFVAEGANVRVVRMHNFTDDGVLMLTKDLDTRALTPNGDLVALSPEFQELGRQFVPGDPSYRPPRAEHVAQQLFSKNNREHVEQRAVISKAQLAQMMPNQQALELTPSPDLEHTAGIMAVLMGIIADNFGKHPENADAPLIVHLDAPTIPLYKKEAVWADAMPEGAANVTLEARAQAPALRDAFLKGQYTPLEIVQMEPRVLFTSKQPLPPAEAVRAKIENRHELEMRDALHWYFLQLTGRNEDAHALVAKKLSTVRGLLQAPATASASDLLEMIAAKLADPACAPDAREELAHERVLVEFLRKMENDTLLANLPDAQREKLLLAAPRFQVALTRTNVWNFKTRRG